MEEKEKLIQELDAARKETYALLEGLDVKRKVYPAWTVKEFLAHLTGWDDATTEALRAHAIGKEPGMPAYRGIDFYNAETVSTRETLDFQHVYREWEAARNLLKAAIRDLPPERFHVPVVYPWGPTGSVTKLVTIMIEHEHEHAHELRSKLGATPQPPPQPPPEPEKPALA